MKNKTTSAKITKVITIILGVILLGLMIGGYRLLKWFNLPDNNIKIMLIDFYICCVPGWTVIVSIYRLMNNIIKGEIFTDKTVKTMGLLSWCCVAVFVVCTVSGFFFIPMWLYSIGSSFMALILWVLKNVMENAGEIKDENDMTI